MKNGNWETIVKPIVVLVLICIITSALLAVTNQVTAPIIEENNRLITLAAYVEVLPEGTTTEDLQDLDVTGMEGVESAVMKSDGSAYAIKSSATGYDGGAITTIIGFDAEGTIIGIWSDSSTQTAGMGDRCDKDDFKGQFMGMSGSAEIGTNVDAISGSTISSEAYVEAVNYAFDCFNQVKGA